jgi:signal transduction histidine kinase
MRIGLAGRMLVASGLLALVVGVTFAVLLTAVVDLRDAQRRATRSEEVLTAANRLERLVVDLETGARGYLLTGRDDALGPWRDARAALPAQAAALERITAADPDQSARTRRIVQACRAYLDGYSVPLVEAAQRAPNRAATAATVDEGGRLVDAIRVQFDGFLATERTLAAARQRDADRDAARAVAAAAGGLTGSVVLIGVFAGYLTRAIVTPVRRVAAMAGRLAGGDLRARLPERGVGEIAGLQRSFNAMAGALERNRDDLAASRARVVAASDQARRRIERDLHDGTQQRLVTLVLELRAAEAAAPPDLRAQIAHCVEDLTETLDELRELSRGIHPAILSDGGLRPALRALARRSPVAVDLDLDLPGRLAEPVEVAAYYVASEALTNAVKYTGGAAVRMSARVDDGRLIVSIADDGPGGAATAGGSGLIGLADRVDAVGGTLTVTSPAGSGTTVEADLPAQPR